jgi:hypothetical protein
MMKMNYLFQANKTFNHKTLKNEHIKNKTQHFGSMQN